MPATKEIDTFNKYFVGGRGDGYVIVNPPRGVMSKDEALNLAAFLVSVVCDDARWQEILTAIQNA